MPRKTGPSRTCARGAWLCWRAIIGRRGAAAAITGAPRYGLYQSALALKGEPDA